MIIEKPCHRCKTVKPVNAFSRNKSRPDGLDWYCKPCRSESSRGYYRQNRDKLLAKAKVYNLSNRESRRVGSKRRYWEQKGTLREEKIRAYKKAHKQRPDVKARREQKAFDLRMRSYEALGGAFCVCCGETTFRLLSLDHINNDGAKHRKADSSSRDMYAWFIKNGMPTEMFQVLCMGCNWGKHANGGHCPHEDERKQFIDIAALALPQAA